MASDPEQAEFGRQRAQLQAEYRRLIQARGWLDTEAPAVMDTFGPLKPVAERYMQPIINALDELVKLGTDEYEKLSPIEWDFTAIGYRDRDIWNQAAQAANEAKAKVEWIDRDRAHDDGLVEADHSGPRSRADANMGRPWQGIAGRAYTACLADQATAAGYLAQVATAASQFMQHAAKSFASVVVSLKNLILQIVVFAALVIVGLAALARAVVAALVTGGGSLIWPFVVFLGAAVQRLTLLTPAVLSYETTQGIFRSEVDAFRRNVEGKLSTDVPAVFRYGAGHAWPDPTTDPSFPTVEQDPRTGKYRVMTELHRRVDAAIEREAR